MYGRGRQMVGYNPWQQFRAGAPILAASASRPYPSFQTAQGGSPAIVPNPVVSGSRVPQPLVSSVAMPINTGTSANLSGRPQGLFRASRLVIGSPQDTTAGFGVTVSNIFIGTTTCMAELGTLSAAIFQATGVDCSVTFDDAAPAIDVGCTVGNVTGTTASIFGQFIGEFVRGGGLALAG